jgi:histidine triad (HIT) family protein
VPFQLPPYDSCGFCAYVSRAVECAVVVDDDLAMAFINHRQYERGAMLVIPKQHRETILEITEPEIASVYALAKRVAGAAARALDACGANVFQNNGIKAGQHVPHMHVHVVPRYENSDSERLFLQRDFGVIDIAEQRAMAAVIRGGL